MPLPTQLTKEEVIELLTKNGFTKDEVEANFDSYLKAITAVSVENYLIALPPAEQEAIIGDLELDNPKNQEEVIKRFEIHFKSHYQDVKLNYSASDFVEKIKNFIISQ